MQQPDRRWAVRADDAILLRRRFALRRALLGHADRAGLGSQPQRPRSHDTSGVLLLLCSSVLLRLLLRLLCPDPEVYLDRVTRGTGRRGGGRRNPADGDGEPRRFVWSAGEDAIILQYERILTLDL